MTDTEVIVDVKTWWNDLLLFLHWVLLLFILKYIFIASLFLVADFLSFFLSFFLSTVWYQYFFFSQVKDLDSSSLFNFSVAFVHLHWLYTVIWLMADLETADGCSTMRWRAFHTDWDWKLAHWVSVRNSPDVNQIKRSLSARTRCELWSFSGLHRPVKENYCVSTTERSGASESTASLLISPPQQQLAANNPIN